MTTFAFFFMLSFAVAYVIQLAVPCDAGVVFVTADVFVVLVAQGTLPSTGSFVVS